MRDPGCNGLAGFSGFSGLTPVCYWHYTPFDNLVEKSDAVQVYGEVNADLSAKTKFHVEVLYAHTDVPDWNTSPSYAALATPTAEASPIAGPLYRAGHQPRAARLHRRQSPRSA
jgi:iron complex outermembrane receptor protein